MFLPLQQLKNGLYTFSFHITYTERFPFSSLSLNISGNGNVHCNVSIKTDNPVFTLLVYNDDIYFKMTDNAHVVTNFNIIGKAPFKISISGKLASRSAGTFKIQTW